jgi:hypothetical protein
MDSSSELDRTEDDLPEGTVLTFLQEEPPRGWELVPGAIVCRKTASLPRPSPAEPSS